MFELLTEKAVKAVMLAEEECRRLGQNRVGPEQLLLGLIGEGTGTAAKALKHTGITLKSVRIEVESIIGSGSRLSNQVHISFTSETQRALELALEESCDQGCDQIDTEHLLLGLSLLKESVVSKVFENLGIEAIGIRNRVLAMSNL